MLRVIEHYTSVQGEGPNTGILTQFIRFAGCNMRCAGWPCDTPQAIEPKIWRAESKKVPVATLVDQMYCEGVENICLTGGEPFMQPDADLHELVWQGRHQGAKFEVFTNGSYMFPPWAIDSLIFIMDWKLQGSHEAETRRAERFANAKLLKSKDNIKFVVKDQTDLREALITTEELEAEGFLGQFWVGAVWDEITDIEIVDFIKEHKCPWRLNVQMHKHIWAPETKLV